MTTAWDGQDTGRRSFIAGVGSALVATVATSATRAAGILSNEADLPSRLQLRDPPRPAVPMAAFDLAGRPRRIGVGGAKISIVNFWATWCVPCIVEIPSLQALTRSLPRGAIEIVAISVDRDREILVQELARRSFRGITVLHDPEGVLFAKLGARSLPTSIIVDAHGRELARVRGALVWDDRRMVDYLGGILHAR